MWLTRRTDHDGLAPSLHPHYGGFFATTSQSANPSRIGTQHLAVSAAVISLSPPARAALSRWAFPRSPQPQQTRLASPSCRTPPGQSAGTRQAHPGDNLKPRFRCRVDNHLDTSSAIHSRSPSWSPPDTSPVPSPHRSPPRPHGRSSMRRFEASPTQGDSEGPSFISCTAPSSATTTYTSRLQRSWHTMS
jgi:hypothetical protein